MNKELSTVEDIRRIDAKLDTVIEKLEIIARLEERHDGAVKRIDRQDQRLDRHSGRLDKLEAKVASNAASGSMVERAGWVVFSAIIAGLGFFLRG